MRTRLGIWIAMVMVALPAPAETVLVADFQLFDRRFVEVDSESLGVISSVSTLAWASDVETGPDGLIHVGGSGGVSRFRRDGTYVDLFISQPDAEDVAFRSEGTLVVLDRAVLRTSDSGVVEYAPDGSRTWQDTIPGFSLMGLTVPHAGPLKDGILGLAFDDTSFLYYLFRWRPDPLLRFVREGPFGPLDLEPATACWTQPGGCAWHPTALADGLSFVTVEGAISRFQQFDLDGSLIRTFAVIPPDPVALSSGVPGTPNDRPSNVLALPDGTVILLTGRRLYRYDSEGNQTGMAPHVFGGASGAGLARWIPFDDPPARCRPLSVGFWKRHCASAGQRRRIERGRSVRSAPRPLPPTHPAMEGMDLTSILAAADGSLAPFGLTACAAIQPDSPSTWREKALRRFGAIALNVEARLLGRRCPVDVDGTTREAGDVIDEVTTLLSSTDEDDLKRAFQLAGRVLGEE